MGPQLDCASLVMVKWLLLRLYEIHTDLWAGFERKDKSKAILSVPALFFLILPTVTC